MSLGSSLGCPLWSEVLESRPPTAPSSVDPESLTQPGTQRNSPSLSKTQHFYKLDNITNSNSTLSPYCDKWPHYQRQWLISSSSRNLPWLWRNWSLLHLCGVTDLKCLLLKQIYLEESSLRCLGGVPAVAQWKRCSWKIRTTRFQSRPRQAARWDLNQMISKNKAPLHAAASTTQDSKSEAQDSEQHEAQARWQWTRGNYSWADDEAGDNYSTRNRSQEVGRNIPHF